MKEKEAHQKMVNIYHFLVEIIAYNVNNRICYYVTVKLLVITRHESIYRKNKKT